MLASAASTSHGRRPSSSSLLPHVEVQLDAAEFPLIDVAVQSNHHLVLTLQRAHASLRLEALTHQGRNDHFNAEKSTNKQPTGTRGQSNLTKAASSPQSNRKGFPEIVFVVVIHTYHKRSKKFNKRPNHRKKILRCSQDRGKAVDNGLSRCCNSIARALSRHTPPSDDVARSLRSNTTSGNGRFALKINALDVAIDIGLH